MKKNVFAACFIICCLLTTFKADSSAQVDVSNFVELSRLGNGVINTIAVSPDGTMAAVAGGLDIGIYRLPSLELVQRIETENSASFIEWLADGTRLGTLHSDNSAYLWNTSDWTEVFSVEQVHSSFATVWSPDGRYLASGVDFSSEANFMVEIWNTANGDTQRIPSSADYPAPNELAFSPDSTRLAVTDFERLLIWDVGQGQELEEFNGEEYDGFYIAWSPDGDKIATIDFGDPQDTIYVFDAASGDELVSLPYTEASNVAWSLDGERLSAISLGEGFQYETLTVWDADGGDELYALDLNGANYVSWSPDSSVIAVAAADGALTLFEGETGEELIQIESDAEALSNPTWSPDGAHIISSGSEGTIHLWDANSGVEIASIEGYSTITWDVFWSADSSSLVLLKWDEVQIVNADTLEVERIFLEGQLNTSEIRPNAALSPDGQLLAISDGSDLYVWDVTTEEQVMVLEGHTDTISVIAWSPDGTMLASSSRDDSIFIWDVATGERVRRLSAESLGFSLAWSSDSTRIAAPGTHPDQAFGFNNLVIWTVESGRVTPDPELAGIWIISWSPANPQIIIIGDRGGGLGTFTVSARLLGRRQELHTDTINDLIWSPDGSYLTSASLDNSIVISEPGLEPIQRLEGHGSGVLNIAWSPDGTRLASTSWDGTVRIWGESS